MRTLKKGLRCQDIMNIDMITGRIVPSKVRFRLALWRRPREKLSLRLLEGSSLRINKPKVHLKMMNSDICLLIIHIILICHKEYDLFK